MATYNGVNLTKTATLSAGVVDQVNFIQRGFLSVVNHDATETIWITNFGTDPTAGGDDNVPILASSAVVLPMHGNQIELFSTGSPMYTAMAL